MSGPRRPTLARQAELTDAALHIIATRGIAALSTRSLAEQVGLSSGAIFKHYATLDALLEAVVTRVEEVLEATYPPPGLGPLARLEAFVESRSAAVGQQLGIMRLVLSEQFLLALPKRSSARLASCVHKTREYVVACVREGQHAGELRTDVEASALAVVVMGTIQMAALSASKDRQLPATQAVRAGLITLLQPPGGRTATGKKASHSTS